MSLPNTNEILMKDKIGDLIIQIISVMIGVFLGLIISNWSSAKKDKRKAEVLVENIKNEIEYNKSNVQNVIDYHKTLRDSARYHLNENKFKLERPKYFRGINTVILNSSAFETGLQTGLMTEISVERIQLLNDIYSKQKSYQEYSNFVLSGLITMDYDQDEILYRKILMLLSVSMTDIVIKEEQLLESYKKASNL